MIRSQEQYAFFLIYTGEIEKIGLLPVGIKLIAIAGILVIGIENGNCIWFEFLGESLTVAFK